MPDTSTIPRSVLVRSDQDSGMALIKSKDGRTKWLTVSTDPSVPSYSWDDRVRAWASRLGVCAMPPSQNQGQATPLPTPPPHDPRSAQQQDWAVPSSSSSSSSSLSPSSSSPTLATDGQTRARGAKRAGSFARGFLLGLGGGVAPSASTAKRDSSSITSPGAACPAVSKDTGANCAAVLNSDDPVKLTTTQPQPGSESRRTSETAAAAVADENVGGGASGGALSGRHRWVKGAPPSPVEGEKNSSEWSSSTGNQSGSDGDDGDMATSADCGGGWNKIDSTEHRIACDRLQDTKLQNGDQSRATQESRVAQTQPALLVKVEASTDSHDADEDDWLHAGNNTGGDLVSSATSGVSSKTAKNRKKKSKASKAKAKSKSKKATTCTPALETAPCAEVATLPDTRGKKSLNVTFSHVRMLEFTRDVGGCAVPSDGTWGLALGLPFRETMVDVDGYEASKAEILEARIVELTKKQRALCTGETRQFDYRPFGERNPLFSRLGEKERSKVLLDYACFHKEDLEEADSSNSHTRGNRCDDDDLSVYSHKISHSDFVDKSQAETPVLNAIRDSRRDSQGCSCASVRADKLNVARLREELNKRGLKVSGSKKDLTKALQEAMRAEEEKDGGQSHKTCRSEDCQCVRDGVECHADLCNCCKGPHMGKKDAHHGGVCGNPEGVYAFSSSAVKSYRHPFVNAKRAPGRDRERKHSRSDSMCSEHQ